MIFILLFFIPAVLAYIDFLCFFAAGRRLFHKILVHINEVFVLIIIPFMYANFGAKNQCCGDSLDTATFSPNHQLTMGVLIVLCLSSYLYCSYRKEIATPIVEVLLNTLLVLGIILNVFIAIHAKESWLIFGGAIPVILYGLLALVKNQQLFISTVRKELNTDKKFEIIAFKILNLNPIFKYPVFLILCLPLMIVLSTILLLFGQKPDSVVRAFTETYKHGFSQWDYQCDNVQCGGHYLCSVAANGHARVVKPIRKGVRNDNYIICNRQLLVSNAFEELVQEKFPALHKIIRSNYDKVGNFIHKYYGVFNNKFVSDVIYILMKPLEWIFLLFVYTFERNPENRIAKQYIKSEDRKKLEQIAQLNS